MAQKAIHAVGMVLMGRMVEMREVRQVELMVEQAILNSVEEVGAA